MEKNCFKKPISFLQFIKKALKSYFLERNTYFLLALHVACLRSQNYAIPNLLRHPVLEVLRDQCPSVLRLYRGCTEAVAAREAAAVLGAFLTLLSPYFRGDPHEIDNCEVASWPSDHSLDGTL